MDYTYWQKQTLKEPLFPDTLWSRPENKQYAGKLLIIGGHGAGFSAPAEAYRHALGAGIGTIKVLLPEALKPTVHMMPDCDFAPSNRSGGFARQSLDAMLMHADSVDGILLAGEFGRNSETAGVLEQFLAKTSKPIAITHDAVDYFSNHPAPIFQRENTLFVGNFGQLQHLTKSSGFPKAFTSEMPLLQTVETLHELSDQKECFFVTWHMNTMYVAVKGRVASTNVEVTQGSWLLKTAAYAAVYWLQQPLTPFESIVTSVQQSFIV